MLQTPDAAGLETIGGRIRAARRAKGLKLGEAATQIGLSRTSLSQWESDAVKNRDIKKLGAFVALVDVNLEWLLERRGDDPDLAMPAKSRRAQAKAIAQARAANSSGNAAETPIIEIAAALTSHAREIDLTPRGLWAIPHQVIEIGFNAEPATTVIKRVITRSQDNFGLSRGDHVLIDTSRNRIDEPGIYIVADPEGISARRALIVERDGQLVMDSLADDLQRNDPQAAVDKLVPLGRVMGILKPA